MDTASPVCHQVTFCGTDTDLLEAREHLIGAYAAAGCSADFAESGSAEIVSLRLPAGGRAILAVGRARDADMAASLTICEPGGDDAAALFRVLDELPLTGKEVSDVAAQMPITALLAGDLGPDVFTGFSVLCSIHHMRDFTAMTGALMRCGADPDLITIIDKGYPYRMRGRVHGWLRHRAGTAIITYPDREAGIAAHLDRAAAKDIRTLVFDDGGYVLPVILDNYAERSAELAGVVEQTMSGIWKLEPYCQIPVPVFSVAESALKASVEAPHVAAAAISSVMSALPDENWAGRPALVLGYGRLGRQAAIQLRDRHRMNVAVYDSSPALLVTAHQDGFTVSRDLPELIGVHAPLLVLGCAGRGSLLGEHASAFTASAYLASMTSRDFEFPLAEWTKIAERVSDYGRLGHGYHLPGGVELCVVGDGLPVNFHHRESVPNRVIDVVFAALLLGGATLARPGQRGHGPGRNVTLADEILAASPALHAYLDLYAGETDRRLLTPAGPCPAYERTPWEYGS